jgi:MscS family membrane protein
MITIFGIEVTLPQQLSFFSGLPGSFLGTIIISAAVAVAIFFLIFVGLKMAFSRTDTEVDDVILGATRWPFIIFAILFSLERSVEVWGYDGMAGWIEKILWASMAVVITYWISRLLKDVALYELKKYSQHSEAAWDDVLAPVLERIVPPVIWTVGLITSLQILGFDMTGLYVALGGTAFILGFALQDVLSNLFSGLVLLLDTPFQFGDVIQLEDGTMAVVKEIGLRVTHLYHTKDHSDIYMPNSVLGGMSIVNITRPTTDLAASVTVGVAYVANSTYGPKEEEGNVTNILKKIIMGHPDVFGDITEKLVALQDFSQFVSGSEKKEKVEKRLKAEQVLNKRLEYLEHELDDFAKLASLLETSSLKKGGLGKNEIKMLNQVYSDILIAAGLKTVPAQRKGLSISKPRLEDDNSGLIQFVRDWYTAWLLDPDLVNEDTEGLKAEWEQKLEFMRIKMERLYRFVNNPIGHERRLDDEAKNIVKWIHAEFKESRVLWKDPDVRLVNFGASSLDFEISYYVDNIKLEHYERADRIQDELRREIKYRLDEAKIEIPFPQTDIWFRSALQSHNAGTIQLQENSETQPPDQ